MKTLQFSMRSFVLGLVFHATAWVAILVSIYFSLMYSQWWPIAVALVVVLAIDGFLVWRQWKRKTSFTVRPSAQQSDDQ
jgi:ABC-type nickel/cobalt efflux system permease component RcnA